MNGKPCANCGNEAAAGSALCAECETARREQRRRRIGYSAFAFLILLLAGAALIFAEKRSWDLSWDALTGRPAAVVNGEAIPRAEVRERLEISRIMLERTYGKGLFAGEDGRLLRARLERELLEKIVEERLVEQEARRLNIRVEDERVRREIDKIGSEIYGDRDLFQASMQEDGISPAYLTRHIRHLLVVEEFKKAVTPPRSDPDAHLADWLVRERRSAAVKLNWGFPPSGAALPASRGCCGSGGGGNPAGCGGCGGRQDPSRSDPALQREAATAALAAYGEGRPAEEGLTTRVTDYGCHLEVDIEKEGRIVRSYRYQDGGVTEK